jgi:hypothetical protein
MFYAAFNGCGTHRISPVEIADVQRPIVLFPVIDKAVNHDSLQEGSATAKIYIRRLNYLYEYEPAHPFHWNRNEIDIVLCELPSAWL